MLRLDLERQAEKFLLHLPPKHAGQIVRKLAALLENPEPPDSLKLQGSYSRFRRADCGEYRIIYRTENDRLRIYLIGKRNDDEVYRLLRRMT